MLKTKLFEEEMLALPSKVFMVEEQATWKREILPNIFQVILLMINVLVFFMSIYYQKSNFSFHHCY